MKLLLTLLAVLGLSVAHANDVKVEEEGATKSKVETQETTPAAEAESVEAEEAAAE